MSHYRVVGPVVSNRGFAFEEISNPAELRLEYPTTILPPKKYLLPPEEVLFRFDRSNGAEITPPPQPQPTVIFGVHTCDVHAIQLLDQVFSNGHSRAIILTGAAVLSSLVLSASRLATSIRFARAWAHSPPMRATTCT